MPLVAEEDTEYKMPKEEKHWEKLCGAEVCMEEVVAAKWDM